MNCMTVPTTGACLQLSRKALALPEGVAFSLAVLPRRPHFWPVLTCNAQPGAWAPVRLLRSRDPELGRNFAKTSLWLEVSGAGWGSMGAATVQS